jgi:hypothetical protein
MLLTTRAPGRSGAISPAGAGRAATIQAGHYGDGMRYNQWLDRASLIVDIERSTSFTIGARKLIGTAPPFPGQGIPRFGNATNLSFALSRRRAHDDIFLVYGDPNTVATTPALLLKYVHYFGADRGT